MSKHSESGNFRGAVGAPFLKGAYAQGSYPDVKTIVTDGNPVGVKPIEVHIHRKPGQLSTYTVFKPEQNSSSTSQKKYSAASEAEEIVNSTWVENEFSEEAGLRRGLNKIEEINPEFAPRTRSTYDDVILKEGLISELTIKPDVVEKINIEDKKRRFSM